MMKTLRVCFLTILALIVISGCQRSTNPTEGSLSHQSEPGVLAKGNSTVTGGGTAMEGDPGSQIRSTFTFNAVKRSDGTVTGNLVYHFRLAGITVWMDINCLGINGNTATLSGIVTRSVPPDNFVGEELVFKVQDNGEGRSADPDLFSDVIYGACQTPPELPLYIVMNGNIQIMQ